jgi:nucleoside-diphosphate-sugar epimerase
MTHLLCFGLGYTARHLSQRLAGRGWQISGTSRTDEGAARLSAAGMRGIAFDGLATSASLTAAIGAATHILVSIPPAADGDPALTHHSNDLLAASQLVWIGYLSTVGVYGDHAGGWVDETTPASPGSERSRRRLAAEAAWLALGSTAGKRVNVFRLPGIYGPGRSAIDSLRAGTARRIIKPGQVFNRMHVADIAAALEIAMVGPTAHAVYNLTDDEPAAPEDVVAYAAALSGMPVPPAIPFSQAQLSPMAASFYAESKRVSNARMKADLGFAPRYPTYREGLAAIAAGQH